MINSYNNLTRIEDKYKTIQSHENLTSLMILFLENYVLQFIDFNETIKIC